MERVEKKYFCSDYEILLLQQRLSAVLMLDEHQRQNAYQVRSLYFDTPYDTCYQDNESGVDERRKYRMRIYSSDNEFVKFEIKSKKHEKVWKDVSFLTREEAKRIIYGQKSGNEKVDFLIAENMLQPKIIVEYDRTAYVYQLGNVRITFDRNISASYETEKFFSDTFLRIPVLSTHMQLMEVKYDEFLPDVIGRILETGNLKQVTFSKYYIGRQKTEIWRIPG